MPSSSAPISRELRLGYCLMGGASRSEAVAMQPGGGARFSPRVGTATHPRRDGDHDMTQEQKIIRAKVGLLELAKQLGNVSHASDMDFVISRPLVRPGMPLIRFLFVRSRFCSTLPSGATSRCRPCA